MASPTHLDPLEMLWRLEAEIYKSEETRLTAKQLRETIIALANAMREHGSMRSKNVNSKEILRSYTVFASQITELFVHGTEEIDYDTYVLLSIYSEEIASIFSISGYQGATHVLRSLSESDGDRLDIKKENLPAACLVLGINEIPTELLKNVLKMLEPNLSVPLIFGWLRESFVYSDVAEENRKVLHGSLEIVGHAPWHNNYLYALNTVYMFCSYANFDHRLDFKKALNNLLTKKFSNYENLTSLSFKKSKKKPKLVILHERFSSNHAMFRCFAKMLSPLKKYFTTIAFAETGHIDEAAEDIFDQVHIIDENGRINLGDLIKRINKIAPDVILYPSIGMSLWSIILSNFRLAHIQIAGQGHPGSTMSDCMDYAIVPEVRNDVEKYYSEKVIKHKNVMVQLHPQYNHEFRQLPEFDRDHVKIAVNSTIMKLSPEFLKMLKQIEMSVNTKLEFNFFPAASGLIDDHIHSVMTTEFANCTVHEEADYPEFIKKLSSCDFSCAAFPFGNTNGAVDACLLGIPSFCLQGKHLSDQNDVAIIKLFKFPDELICLSVADYKNKVVRMIEDIKYRKKLTQKCWELDTRKILDMHNNNEDVTYAKAINRAYLIHLNNDGSYLKP